MQFHDLPYTDPGPNCRCAPQSCGGLIIRPDCPNHGHRTNPAMERHQAGNERCRHLARDKENSMSDDTANHRPADQDPDPYDEGTMPAAPWDGRPLPGETVSDVSPF